MKKSVKNLLCCLLSLALILGGIYGLGFLFRPFETDIAQNAIETFHSLPENTVEVIGYGSSHIFRSLDVMEMYQNYGIGAYNYGNHWQHINTTALFVRDSLRTQSPKVALIEVGRVNYVLEDSDMDGEIYYTRYIPDFPAKDAYLKQCFGENRERYLSYYVPFAAFHENWSGVQDWSFRDGTKDYDFLKTMGYLELKKVTPVTIGDPATFRQEPLGPESRAALDDIVAACREADVEIIFYTAPWEREYLYGNALKEYAKENDFVYFNMFEMMEEIGIDCNTDFSDTEHLNESGAKKVANFLGTFIKNNYDVTDMRGVANNLWQQQLEK